MIELHQRKQAEPKFWKVLGNGGLTSIDYCSE